MNREIDRLFQLPLQEFTAARNALSARLKKAGRNEEAAQVSSVAKPPVSAWAVNQLYWRHGQDFSRLLQTGDRFRDAQQGQLAGKRTDLRGAMEARREALSSLLALAPEVLRDAGHDATPDLMRRITTTLEALATYGTLPEAPAAGRLMEDMQPLGFETLAALVPRRGDGREKHAAPRVLPFSKKREAKETRGSRGTDAAKRNREAEIAARRAAARKAVDAAERTLREARETVQKVQAAFKKAAAHAKTTQRAKEDAEKRFEAAAAAAEEASREAHRIAREAEDAAQAVTDAERELERARNALKEL